MYALTQFSTLNSIQSRKPSLRLNAKDVLLKYIVPILEEALEKIVETHILDSLLKDLNSIVGISSATCIEGG
ncbi:hypothetical protein DFO73_103445 [Cytobacillus oceanisediminis]|uniref:Uncharacterized protein n=1 Tax=Cytobacillus oceanisediminis TaxID=665099 RepID=A0A2V3A1F1_9BACI|nr:hypothetical protein [Cytobacillus oceanisediminis]PWW30552.1 hypothetical protein DFO73_103445 [Cytobacillus oceanisediminis]